jgi:Fe-S cluster biogenesis protein NfuA
MTLRADDIAITAEPTANPQVCRFVVDRPLHDGGAVHCESRDDAADSPLLAALFGVADVREVLVLGRTVTVGKDGMRPWQEIGREIGAAIRGAVAAGPPLVAPRWNERTGEESDIRDRVARLLEQEINPQIASHGGFVRVADVQGTTVLVEMGGGCQGCAASQATLRGGVEQAIRRAVPEVTEIIDVTDHAAGDSPYYR